MDAARELPARIEALLDGFDDPRDADRAQDLVAAVLELYGAGLARAVALVDDPAVVRRLADDDLVGSLLLLHDLHPDDVDTRIQRALDTVRPFLGMHAGGISYQGVDGDGVAHLTLEGSCDGCGASAATVQVSIEGAVLSAAPEVARLEVVGVVPEPELLQIGRYRPDECPVP